MAIDESHKLGMTEDVNHRQERPQQAGKNIHKKSNEIMMQKAPVCWDSLLVSRVATNSGDVPCWWLPGSKRGTCAVTTRFKPRLSPTKNEPEGSKAMRKGLKRK